MLKSWGWNIYACPCRPLAGWRAGCSPLVLSCCVIYWTGVLSWTLEGPKAVVDWHHHICDVLFWAFTSVQAWRSQSALTKHWREACVLQLWDQLFFSTAPLALVYCPSHLRPRSVFMAPRMPCTRTYRLLMSVEIHSNKHKGHTSLCSFCEQPSQDSIVSIIDSIISFCAAFVYLNAGWLIFNTFIQ